MIPPERKTKLTGNDLDLRDAVRVPQHDANLAGRRALLGELADLVDDLVGRDLEPRGRGAGVGDRAGGDAFAVAVEAAHDFFAGVSFVRICEFWERGKGKGNICCSSVFFVLGGRQELR